MKTRLRWFGWCVAIMLAVCVAPVWGDSDSGGDSDSDSDIDVILEWNAVALEVNAIDHTALDAPGDQLSDTQGPPNSARALAMVHAAMFDAYNSIDRRYTKYLTLVDDVDSDASIDAAVATAASDVILALIPSDQRVSDFVSDALVDTLDRVDDDDELAEGIAVGQAVAAAILAARANDGPFLDASATGPGAYFPTGAPGNHDVDPKNPGQGFISPRIAGLTPFAVPSVLPFRAPPPPLLASSEYLDALDEVEALGVFRGGTAADGPAVPTDDETYVIANYWSYNGSPMVGTPPRLYNQIARVVAKQEENEVHENARLFALVNLTMADGGISAWDSKYFYAYWRPALGVPLVGDPLWCALGGSRSNPFLVNGMLESNFTPPFPAYTSGHATFGAATFKTLANFYQTDRISFTFVSDEWNGTTLDQFNRVRPLLSRSFSSLSQASAENAASRVFNGVHWRFDGTEGVRAGNAIADSAFENLLLPLDDDDPQAIPDTDFAAQIDDILTGGDGDLGGGDDDDTDSDSEDSDSEDSD